MHLSIKRGALSLCVAAFLMVVPLALPAAADGSPVTDPAVVGTNCIRIDLLPGYASSLTLGFAYDLVILNDGAVDTTFEDARVGDTLSTSSGLGIRYVIKCGFGGIGNYAKGTHEVEAVPVSTAAPDAGTAPTVVNKIQYTVDGCQPGSLASISLDGVVAATVTVPASGYLTGYLVLDAGTPAPSLLSVTCNDYTESVPVDESTVGVGPLGVNTPAAPDAGQPAVAGGDAVDVDRAAIEAATTDLPDGVVAAVRIGASGQSSAAASAGSVLEEVVNPASAVRSVTAEGGVSGDEFAVLVLDGSAGVEATSGFAGGSMTALRLGLAGLAGAGLLTFVARRRMPARQRVTVV